MPQRKQRQPQGASSFFPPRSSSARRAARSRRAEGEKNLNFRLGFGPTPDGCGARSVEFSLYCVISSRLCSLLRAESERCQLKRLIIHTTRRRRRGGRMITSKSAACCGWLLLFRSSRTTTRRQQQLPLDVIEQKNGGQSRPGCCSFLFAWRPPRAAECSLSNE